jgi:hypothetical protein
MKISEMTRLEYRIYNMLKDGYDPHIVALYLDVPIQKVMFIATEQVFYS